MIDIRSYEPGEATFYKLPDSTYISVEVERYPYNPRELGDGLGTFLIWGHRYKSIDDNPYRDPDDFIDEMLGEGTADSCNSMQDVARLFHENGYVFQGIYRFEHSGVSYSLGDFNPYADRWDSGPVGFAYVSPEELDAEGMSVEQALKYMESEMKEYDAYARGDVWLVTRFDEQGLELDTGSFYGLDAVEEEYGFIVPVTEITREQAFDLEGSGQPVFESAEQKAAYERGEGEPSGYEGFEPLGRFVWQEADGMWHAMDNSLGLGINKDAAFRFRYEAESFARGNHAFETAEVAMPEKLEIENEAELALYAKLEQEWSVVRNDNGDCVRFEKSDVAIVEDETGFWRIENAVTHELSVEIYDSPVEALEAFESYASLSNTLESLDLATAASKDQVAHQQQEQARETQDRELGAR